MSDEQWAQLTTTSLSMPSDASFEEWAEQGQRLFTMERAVMWWIGDWWRFGEHRYGERAAAALDSRYSFQTFMDAGWVAGQIETSRRREVLSWSHHKEVAALPAQEQDYWLDEAEQGHWSRKELRAAMKRGKQEDGGEEPIDTDAWHQVLEIMESIERLPDAAIAAATVPSRRRAATAKRLRQAGVVLGRIAWKLEGMEAFGDHRGESEREAAAL